MALDFIQSIGFSSAAFAQNPQLNISKEELGLKGLDYSPEGDAATTQPTATGSALKIGFVVIYLVTVDLIKGPLLAQFERQMNSSSSLGEATFRKDTTGAEPLRLFNVSLVNISEETSGDSPTATLTIRGARRVNQDVIGA